MNICMFIYMYVILASRVHHTFHLLLDPFPPYAFRTVTAEMYQRCFFPHRHTELTVSNRARNDNTLYIPVILKFGFCD